LGLYPNVYTIVAQRTRSRYLAFPYSMSAAEADRIDLVHIAAGGPLALVAHPVASRFGLPTIVSLRLPPPATSGVMSTCGRALVRRSRRLLVTSMAARGAFLRAGISASKIIVWRPGVNASIFAPSRRSAALRERWGVSDACPAVIYAGDLSDERSAWRLLSMEIALRRTRPMHQLTSPGTVRAATTCWLGARTPCSLAPCRATSCRRFSHHPICSFSRAKLYPQI
jgi:hypothetical protein